MASKIIEDPLNTLKTMTTKQIVNILEAADTAFFNTDVPLFPDDIYDLVKDYLRKQDPKNPYLKKVGAQVTAFAKEKLPFYLGSLDKIKDNEAEILKWKNKYTGDYIVSEKLDGISCLLYENQMYSRGDGFEGQNISHILPYINTGPSGGSNGLAVRGELIISKKNWGHIADSGANARNVVAGAVHSKNLNREILSKIDFVAYDVLYPRQRLSESFDILKKTGMPLVNYMHITDAQELTLEMLSKTLQDWRSKSAYEIDGIVVCHNAVHNIMSGKNPKYAFAFKTILTHEQAEVIVSDVEWNVSKHRYLKPIVQFNEVTLAGVKIKQATGFNAAYIKNNIIGPGARIIIVRSGDVIPHIISVLKPAANGKPKMPANSYVWNDTGIDILLAGDEKNKDQDIQAFTHFMKTLGIEGVKEGVLSKLYDAGYDTLGKIINISLEDLRGIDGFKDKSATNVYNALQKIQGVSCDKLLAASNVFGRGFGEKKLQLITAVHPYIADNAQKGITISVNDLKNIKGIAETTAKQFVENLPKFYRFLDSLGIKCKKTVVSVSQDVPKKTLDIFRDTKVVFTGFRNKEYEQIIKDSGGTVVSAISGQTNYLIVKDLDAGSTKIDKAMGLGIKIMTKEEFDRLL